MTTGHETIRIASRSRHIDLLLGAGLVLAATLFAVFAWAAVAGPPQIELSITHPAPDTWTVASVPIGGPAWNAGVRPGMDVIGAEPSGADPAVSWDSLLVTDGRVRIGIARNQIFPSGDLPTLAGLALVLAALAALRLPNVGWLLALGVVSVVVLNATPLFGPPANLALLVVGPLLGTVYAVDRRRRVHPRVAVPIIAADLLVVVALAAAYVTHLANWQSLPGQSVMTAWAFMTLGLAGVVLHAWHRSRVRMSWGPSSARSVLSALADELVPGRARTRQTALEEERSQIATALHADVLPDLSTLIREVEAGAQPEQTARHLRSVAAELRDLMAERRLAILDEEGLLPALEWLAERIEERSGVTVELDVEEAGEGDQGGRPPHDVELAVYRIAQQALDNALLHGRPNAIHLRIQADASRVALQIADDGAGMEPDAERRALRAGHLGLADMRQRAEVIGAQFSVRPAPTRGTVVTLKWPA